MAKRKIAILGGGPAGLAAAMRLTEEAGDDVEITIYQMGWRVGGKGTSGYRRWTPPGANAPIWNRIEEHGLHILFGFYENVFGVMRRVYEELDRPSDHPLGSFEKAFEPRDFATTMYRHRSRWKRWHVWFHRNAARPGTDDPLPEDNEAHRLGSLLASLIRNVLLPFRGPHPATGKSGAGRRFFDSVGTAIFVLARAVLRPIIARPRLAMALLRFWQRHLRHWTHGFANLFGPTYLMWLGADYFVALTIGSMRAGLPDSGDYASIDHLDFREWLGDNGIHSETQASPLVATVYHAAFSYEGGDPERPRAAAGAALRLLRLATGDRRGSAYNRMRGGMGEVVFVPLMQVLEKRGVRFELFSKVEAVRLDDAGQRIQAVEITRQVPLAAGRSRYDPLIEVKGVEAFPAEPLWDQLKDGGEIAGHRFDSYYEPDLQSAERFRLERGEDFDDVVLATPVATLPYVAADLLDHSARWHDMVEHVKSVQTLSLQVWFDETHLDLGWDQPDRRDPHTLLSMYAKPMSTWVPMDQTLPRENWPEGMEPRAVSYFTGTQPGPEVAPDPQQEPDFPEEQTERARVLSEYFMRNLVAEDLLQKLENPIAPPQPRFEALHDPEGRERSARFEAQYVRSNCEPSERITLALPGATQHRMRAGETGYENLVVAGDWIENGILMACMEGAFLGGLMAGDALLERMQRG